LTKGYKIIFIIILIISVNLDKFSYGNGKFSCENLLTAAKIGENDFYNYQISKKIINNEFKMYEIGNRIVCYYERKVGEIIFEKDFLNYQFNADDGELISKKIHWRDDVNENLASLVKISKEEINEIAMKQMFHAGEAEILWSKLYLISPQSDVFRVSNKANEPCWVVRLKVNEVQKIIIYNALTGEYIGEGIIPPESGFTFSGPWYSGQCSGSWDGWYLNAAYWFEQFGYPVSSAQWPPQKQLRSQVANSDSKLFYEIAHGNSDTFASGCTADNSFEFTYAYNIRDWIANSDKKSFIFLGSCEGMCYTGSNTFSYEFRKGSNENTVSIGYCGMSTEHCDSCWYSSIDWQNALFNYIKNGNKVKQAFDRASADYPLCIEPPACMRFAGDENFILPIKEYILMKKDFPHIEINWYPPNNSNILYKQSLLDEFQILYSQVYSTVKHNNVLLDSNNYFYAFEMINNR